MRTARTLHIYEYSVLYILEYTIYYNTYIHVVYLYKRIVYIINIENNDVHKPLDIHIIILYNIVTVDFTSLNAYSNVLRRVLHVHYRYYTIRITNYFLSSTEFSN